MTTFAVGSISKIWRFMTGTAHQGGNFRAGKIPTTTLVTKFRSWQSMRCLAMCSWRPNKRQTSFRRLPLYISFERLVPFAISREKSRQNQQGKLRLSLLIMKETVQPHVKRTIKGSMPRNIIIMECLDIFTHVKARTATKHESQGQADKGYHSHGIYKVR